MDSVRLELFKQSRRMAGGRQEAAVCSLVGVARYSIALSKCVKKLLKSQHSSLAPSSRTVKQTESQASNLATTQDMHGGDDGMQMYQSGLAAPRRLRPTSTTCLSMSRAPKTRNPQPFRPPWPTNSRHTILRMLSRTRATRCSSPPPSVPSSPVCRTHCASRTLEPWVSLPSRAAQLLFSVREQVRLSLSFVELIES